MPYNLCGNATCAGLMYTLIDLLKSLLKEQKCNWPLHLPLLVFAYNAMPHSSTSYQPYELMFEHKAPTILMHGLGWQIIMKAFCKASVHRLTNSMNSSLLQIGMHKRIRHSAKRSVSQAKRKGLNIPIGNLMLLCDWPEG